MPQKGDNYTVKLKETYIDWGDDERKTSSREKIKDEVYLPIPAKVAKKYNIYMSNKKGANTEYNIKTSDEFLINGKLKAQGCSKSGDIYAKNLSGSGNLKLLSPWLKHIKAKKDDKIKVEWTSPTDILLTKI